MTPDSPAPASPSDPAPPLGTLRSRLSEATAQVMRGFTGRGPVRARAIVDGNAVIVIMEDTPTRGERHLVEQGSDEEAMEIRAAFQAGMQAEMREAIESVTGRPVAAFMSVSHPDPDYSVEIFMLSESVDEAG
jgi:uncharacterized protein YbcI